ncbi:hypothetical protein [Nonomuraea gerenzanensis]|uniref:Uncharacterized protein n=1 Tax=Nonomuraea gerenzanensis TaxID=93944 RepID=A0A1M4ELQ6_9ACTN|nr:hypothetical protein [Nonomuraea gerenzanensis]UBU11294.1 hypothetical protein LCN96_44420 [Nonomuraea gerenzanensis]SBO99770.1 hypothetical protein BN4615_P9286 [Nonomuraea gerenzanensis]
MRTTITKFAVVGAVGVTGLLGAAATAQADVGAGQVRAQADVDAGQVRSQADVGVGHGPAQAAQPVPDDDDLRVADPEGAPVRAGPGPAYDIVDRMEYGEAVQYDETTGYVEMTDEEAAGLAGTMPGGATSGEMAEDAMPDGETPAGVAAPDGEMADAEMPAGVAAADGEMADGEMPGYAEPTAEEAAMMAAAAAAAEMAAEETASGELASGELAPGELASGEPASGDTFIGEMSPSDTNEANDTSGDSAAHDVYTDMTTGDLSAPSTTASSD